jgi:iron complex outermembrane receptor protein
MKYIILSAAIVGAASASFADNDDRVFRLGEIQVSTSIDSGAESTATKVGDEDMKAFNRSTVGAALDLIPGANAWSAGSRNEHLVFIRGFDLRQVPLLLDGIPIYVPYDGYVDLSRFATFDLSEIQVSKGFASVLTGPNAMGGAINLVSRRPRRRLEGSVVGTLTADRTGSTSGGQAVANLGLKRELWYAQFGVSEINKNHFRMSDDFHATSVQPAGNRGNSDSDDRKFSAKLAFTPNSSDEYALSYVDQRARKGVPPYAGTDPAISVRYWRWPYWDKQSLYWLSRTGLGDKAYFKSRAFYDRYQNAVNSYDDATYSTQLKRYSFRSAYDDATYGGSIEAGRELTSDNTLKGALHFKQDRHTDQNVGEPVRNFSDNTYSVALEDTHHFSADLSVTAGASYDWRESLAADNYNSKTGTVSPFAPSRNYSLNPQIGFNYRVDETSDWHVNLADKSRFPTIKDRYSYRMGSALPNPGLKPERALNFEIGAGKVFSETTRVEVSLFQNSVSDAIQAVNVSSSVVQNQNVGRILDQGFELSVRSFALARTELGGHYTFLHRRNESNPDIYPTGTPEHRLFVFAKHKPLESVSITPSLEACGRRVVRSDGLTTAGFVLANVKSAYEVSSDFSIEAGINNIADRDYEIASGFPAEGRSYYVGGRFVF